MSKRFQIVVSAVLFGILAAMVLRHFLPKNNVTRSSGACRNNLWQIDGATHQWALEHGKTIHDTPTWDDIRPYLCPRGESLPTCDRGGTYTLGDLSKLPQCGYPGHFVALTKGP